MKLRVVLAGCILIFSFNAYSQSTISFFGFGDVSADKLCILETQNDDLIYIKSVFAAVDESDGFISTNCTSVNNGRASTDEIINACAEIGSGFSVGFQSVASIEPFANELAVYENLSICQ